jgi:hypothetical protein
MMAGSGGNILQTRPSTARRKFHGWHTKIGIHEYIYVVGRSLSKVDVRV